MTDARRPEQLPRNGLQCGSRIDEKIRSRRFVPIVGLLLLNLLVGGVVQEQALAANPTETSGAAAVPSRGTIENNRLGWNMVAPAINAQLDGDQKTLHGIFDRLNNADPAGNELILNDLARQTSAIQQRTHGVIGQIQSYDTVIGSFLQVLGDKAVANEAPSITAQRQQMQADAQSIKATFVRARLYELQAKQLATVIDNRRSRIQQATLSHRTSSPLAPRFWYGLLAERKDDVAAFGPGGSLSNWFLLLGGVVLSIVLTGIARRPFAGGIRHLGAFLGFSPGQTASAGAEAPNVDLPGSSGENHLTAAASSPGSVVITTLTGLVCGVLAPLFWLIWEAAAINGNGGPVSVSIADILPVCGFVLGACLPESLRFSSRSGFKTNVSSRALRGTNWLLACGLLVLGLLHAFQIQSVFGPVMILSLEIVFALGVSLLALVVCRNLDRKTEASLRVPAVLGLATFLTAMTVVAILLGYVSFAFSLTGWLLVFGTGMAVVVLFGRCWRVLVEHLLGAEGFFGSRLLPLGVSARLLSQTTVILTGLGNVFLVLLLFAIAQSDGDLNLPVVFSRLAMLFSGSSIRGVPISLDTVLVCIGILIAAHYAIRKTREWMSDRLFPTTRLDIGSQTSIISIFSYCGWILVGLAVLSIAGVSVRNLTWVVSALSVGIGFGLQSIVQNFVSGIILLAERPVRVGDVVEIGGTRGDVRRISVRATNLSLSDGSTMIVPNSQFITGSVKNATFGGAGSAMTLTFIVPASVNLDQARSMLLEVTAKHSEVLSVPAPKVRFTALGADNVTMALSFSLGSVRDNGGVQDTLLFDIFRRFHTEEIAIATA